MVDLPQRITPPAGPGVLLKRLMEINVRRRIKDMGERDPVHLALVRQMPCLKCGMEPPPSNEAAHVRLQSAAHGKTGGMGKKPADRWALPLCAACHRIDRDALHQIGENLFWHLLNINPHLLCERLYAARGNVQAMRAVVLSATERRV